MMGTVSAGVDRIVVGIDGSEASAAALRWAARLAAATGAEVLVVHVVEPPAFDVRPLGLPRAILNETGWREALAAEMEGTWCEPLVRAGVRHRIRVEEGPAGRCLAEVAGQEHAGLVVTGRSRATRLAELVHGGVGAYVTHHAPCPVALIPVEGRAA